MPYTTTVRAGVVYDSGIDIGDADDLRLLRSDNITNGVSGSIANGFAWQEVSVSALLALPATVSRNVLLDPNRARNTLTLRFPDSDPGDPDAIYYVCRSAANTLLIGVADDSDAYVGMFAQTRNNEVARWAHGGNTDRIPKSKLPSDTAYTTSPVPAATAADRGKALFVDVQGQYLLRLITAADVPGDEFTTEEKAKLAGIDTGAQVNVKPDWNALATADAGILNKPDVPQVVSTLLPPEDALPDFRLRNNGGLYDVFAKGATPTPHNFRFVPAGGIFDTSAFGGRRTGSSVDVPTEAGAWAVRPVYVAVATAAGRTNVQLLVDEAMFPGPVPAQLDFRILDGGNVVVVGTGARVPGQDRSLARAYAFSQSGAVSLANGTTYTLQVGGAGTSGNSFDQVNLYNVLSPYRWNLIVANLVSQVDARLDQRIQIVDSAADRPADHATRRVLFAW